MMNCPPEFLDYYAARATYFGPLVTDVISVKELLAIGHKTVEERESLAERVRPGEIVSAYGILGFYKTREEASAALQWVRAWRRGS